MINPVETVGSGKTFVLDGAAVVTTGKIVNFQEGIVDMMGEGAKYTPFSKTMNAVLVFEPVEGLEKHEYEKACRFAGFRSALYLAEAAWKAGCYKVMLLTGSKTPSTHAYYRACGFDPTAKQAYLARPPYQVRIHTERKSQPGVPSGAESNRHTGASTG